MNLSSYRTVQQLVVEQEPPTASWTVGHAGVASIEVLPGGVVVIVRESGRDVVIGPTGYGVAVRQLEQAVEPKKGRAK